MNQAANQLFFPQAGAPQWQMLPPATAATASFVAARENASPWACTKFHSLHPFTWGLPQTDLRGLENSREGFTAETSAQTSRFPCLRIKNNAHRDLLSSRSSTLHPVWELGHSSCLLSIYRVIITVTQKHL